MKKEVFTWKMSAEAHKGSVYALRSEIINHYEQQKPLDLITILNLVPLYTEDAGLIFDRGAFEFNGNDFSNSGEEIWVSFYDDVIGDYFVTIPSDWTGTIDISNNVIDIIFTSEVLLEIPELANLGVDRSTFQRLTTIKSTQETTISVLVDSNSEEKETWIDAVLVPSSTTTKHYPQYELISMEKFDTSTNSCGPDTGDANWYVYKRTDGLCFVHHGKWIEGGSIAYVELFGPSTKEACDEFERQHCY